MFTSFAPLPPPAGPHEEIDYSAKLKFSDDEGEEDGEEERGEAKNGAR